jgi:hypothetical protein
MDQDIVGGLRTNYWTNEVNKWPNPLIQTVSSSLCHFPSFLLLYFPYVQNSKCRILFSDTLNRCCPVNNIITKTSNLGRDREANYAFVRRAFFNFVAM